MEREELIIRKQRDVIANLKAVGLLYSKGARAQSATKKDVEEMTELCAIGEMLETELKVLESLSSDAKDEGVLQTQQSLRNESLIPYLKSEADHQIPRMAKILGTKPSMIEQGVNALLAIVEGKLSIKIPKDEGEKTVYEKSLEIADKFIAETSPEELAAIIKEHTPRDEGEVNPSSENYPYCPTCGDTIEHDEDYGGYCCTKCRDGHNNDYAIGASTPPPSLSAEEMLKVRYRDDKWEPTFMNIVAFAEDYARTVGDKPTVKEDLTVADEEISDWANNVNIVAELNDPFIKTEDDLSPYQWAVFGAKWMRDLIKERTK